MNFLTGFLRTSFWLGAVQGFIISRLLFFSKTRQSSRILSKLISWWRWPVSNYMEASGWFDSSDLMRILDAIIPMIMCDAIRTADLFLYEICSWSDFKLNKKDRIHFYLHYYLVPQIMAIIYFSLLFLTDKNNYKPFGVSLVQSSIIIM